MPQEKQDIRYIISNLQCSVQQLSPFDVSAPDRSEKNEMLDNAFKGLFESLEARGIDKGQSRKKIDIASKKLEKDIIKPLQTALNEFQDVLTNYPINNQLIGNNAPEIVSVKSAAASQPPFNSDFSSPIYPSLSYPPRTQMNNTEPSAPTRRLLQ